MTGRDALVAEVWADLRRLVTEVRNPRTEIRDRLGLSFVKAKALRLLDRNGPLTLRELTQRLGTDPPYTTVIVDWLEEARYVERRPHPTDRRAKEVHLTRAGRRMAHRAEQVLGEPPAELAALDDDDLATLLRLLTAILADAPGGS